ncbi:cysteine proteinase, partial [Aureobasidium melanogenum]
MPPKKKRRTDAVDTPQASPPPEPTTPTLDSWPGWCEIESEPAFFTTILKDMGVRDLRVHEVFGVDDDALAILPKPVHAVIFLFKYQEDGTAEQAQENICPPHVWFANQISQYACGTVALLNIVNNVPNLDLGQPLESFKDYTQSFDPVARGYAIDSFDFVRKIHNSFARDTDMLIVDSAVRSNPSRKARTSKSVVEAEEEEQESEESGFHFVAYMPIGEDVWKLDGLDSFPTTIGKTSPGRDWLDVVQTSLSVRMAQYEEGQIQFSLMAVVQDPVVEDRRLLAQNVLSLQKTELLFNQAFQDWRNYTTADHEYCTLFGGSEEYGLTDRMITEAEISENMAQQLHSSSLESLLKARQELITNQAGCRAQVRDSQQANMMDAEESMHRRHDYGSFVKAWMQALVDNEALKSLVDEAPTK